jgi:M6 family metalloprotease-like protein
MSAIFGETLVIEQEDGPPIELVVWGDEFYVRYETKEGYTVIYDSAAGRFCYADVRDGRFVSTGASANKRPPVGLRRHLQESPAVQHARFETRYARLRPREEPVGDDNVPLVLGPNEGLLEGRRVSEGDVVGLTVLVAFTDEAAAVTADDATALLNADNYTTNGNFGSVRAYYSTMSSGKLNYTNHVVGPITLSHDKKHYETTSLVPEAFGLAMAELEAAGVDLAQFDSKGEGTIDAVNFMYAGGTVYGVNGNNNNPSELWPHNSVRVLQHNGYRTHFYMLSSMGRQAVDLSIGTFCHESGHLLCRFPDIYDYGRRDGDFVRSRGIGSYCLMGGGNHLNRGRTPSPICAYLRDLVGWIDNEVSLNGPGVHEAVHGDYGTVMKYGTGLANEYFLIENRARIGLDAHLPSSGLAIYHCDRDGSNEWQEGTPARHYQTALLQADGRRDLEGNLPSDSSDLFGEMQGIALGHDTLPASRMWDGSASGLTVSDISAPGEVIRFNVGDPAPAGAATGEAIAHLLIPDNDPDGILSPISLSAQGELTGISVTIDITHSYIGDLQVNLNAPSGASVMLHDREGRWRDDIRTTYTHENSPLADLEGEDVFGEWTLHVRDMAGRDVGRLNRWSIEVTFESPDETVSGEAQPDLEIPDADTTGVSSAIAIAPEGVLEEVRVHVEIAHTYIGDLYVELVAPSGQSAMLHNQTGRFADDLRVTYDHSLAPALDALVGASIQGDWTLRVRDLQQWDKGRLESWSIELRYKP